MGRSSWRRSGVLVVGLLFSGIVSAAEIVAPSTSSTGTFTVTWSPGYELWLADSSWRFAGPPTTSTNFTSLPSGVYKFVLVSCGMTYMGWEIGYVYSCSSVPASAKTVTVTRDAEPAIATSSEAGSTAYTANVTGRGAAQLTVPIRATSGPGALAPKIALRYDSARGSDRRTYTIDDVLGYGWELTGLSRLHRCIVGLADTTAAPTLTTGDRLCLDGMPLVLTAGTYWSNGSEYRLETDPDVKVTQQFTSGVGNWYEVRYPDGRVGRFGDTTTSQVAASGYVPFNPFGGGGWGGASPIHVWGLRLMQDGLGNELAVAYDRFDGYGMLMPASVSYEGAEVQFKYGPRDDLPVVVVGNVYREPSNLRRHAVLNRILVRMGNVNVREYRLDSNLVGGRLRLERVQECGYNAAGTTATCLKPLELTWGTVTGSSDDYPIAVTQLRDGTSDVYGARTQFTYSNVTTSSNPIGFTEASFGTVPTLPNTATQAVAAVSTLRVSDGLGAGALRTWTYRYKGLARRSTQNRGYLGFAETRVQESGVTEYTYAQRRFDWPFLGAVSHTRVLNNTFGAHTQEFAREEHAFAQKVHANGSRHTWRARSTRWVFEGTATVGGEVATYTPCFRDFTGDTCPGSGTELDALTQLREDRVEGNTVSNPTFTPGFWGDVPVRTVSSVQRTTVSRTNLHRVDSPTWIRNAPKREVVTHYNGTSGDPRTVSREFAYLSGTRLLESSTWFPAVTGLTLTLTRSFDTANKHAMSSETVTGDGVDARTTTFQTPYINNRYVSEVTRPVDGSETHVTSRTMDHRFGQPDSVTDANGRTTDIEYDPFGRVVRETAPDGTESLVAYERCDLTDCANGGHAEVATKITATFVNGSTQVAPTRVTYLDILGRPVLTEVEALRSSDGSHRQRTVYDTRGRVQYVTRPNFGVTPLSCSGAGSNCTWYTYDSRSRVTREDRPDGGFTTTVFSGATGSVTVTVTETVKTPGLADVTRAKQSVFNVLGQLTSTTDAYGTGSAVTTAYTYTSHGDLATVTVGGTTVATLSYDLAGNRTQIVEPNTGTTQFAFNALGELTSTTDARSQTSAYVYDLLGRLTSRTDQGGVVNTWTWDPAYAKGALGSRSRTGFTETYRYEGPHGKLDQIVTSNLAGGVWSSSYTRSFTYDAAGRLATQTYPASNFTAEYAYTAQGYLSEVRRSGHSTVLHRFESTDPFGNATEERFHNNAFRTIRGFDAASGRLTSTQTGTTATPKSIQDLETVWRSNSTLYRRIDKRNTVTTGDDYVDTFSYDALERLTQQATTVGASRTLTFAYSATGNLTSKTSNVSGDLNVTGYTYSGPHRLTSVTIGGISNTLSYDNNGNLTQYAAASGPSTWLTYDARNNVTQIHVGPNQSTIVARDQFWYDTDDQRVQSLESWDESGTPRTRRVLYLGGDYEYVLAPANATHDRIVRLQITTTVRAIARRRASDQQWDAWYYEYVHRDHLGSVDAITDSAGSVQQKTSFDPFGGRRATTWNADLSATGLNALRSWQDSRGSRGFTDHEHLNRTGFIHMNGRVYDPRIGRFVSPDPIVQFPDFSQSYNRYSYTSNSPLSWTDPTGFTQFDWDRNIDLRSSPRLGESDGWYSVFLPGGSVYSHGGHAESGIADLVFDYLDFGEFNAPVDGALPDPMQGDPSAEAGRLAWDLWSEYGSYIELGVGVGLIALDILNTPISPTPDLGIIGAGLIARGTAARGSTTVIGKLDDLKNLAPGERTLLDRLPNLGSSRANWYQNSSVLRQEMALGRPIRDASVDSAGRLINNTGFLRAERNLLETRGWIYNQATRMWHPPGP
ncbi:MAG: RHS repeat-associated core domain-containing protein [Pseudomonadales bacterium]|nr:RHS repeat-associated core domain-containing protein [Pseudomonadales bacterium]